MIINFTKMHGLGNDFVIIDLITQGIKLNSANIVRIADRRFGIGCDQVILLQAPNNPDTDFFYRIYNADGQEVEQCGNGVRCAAKFFVDNGLTNKNTLVADCLGGPAHININENKQVTVNLGKSYTAITPLELETTHGMQKINCLSIGNPHGVCVVDDLQHIDVKDLGSQLSTNPAFAHGANIGFMQIVDQNKIKLRVYERGAGLTHACGSGACAAMLVGNYLGLLSHQVRVEFAYGELSIELNHDKDLLMTGSATTVFLGKFRL